MIFRDSEHLGAWGEVEGRDDWTVGKETCCILLPKVWRERTSTSILEQK